MAKIGRMDFFGTTIPVFECDICKEKIPNNYPRVQLDDGQTFCGDCAFINGIIDEQQYLKQFCYWVQLSGLRATVKDGKVHLATGKFPWERIDDRHNRDYERWRKAVFERDGYTCQHCGKVGGTLNAHHIKPWKSFKELRFEVSNGQTLCEDCHKAYHKKHGK